jgi:uncharacterized membrane protein YadS
VGKYRNDAPKTDIIPKKKRVLLLLLLLLAVFLSCAHPTKKKGKDTQTPTQKRRPWFHRPP